MLQFRHASRASKGGRPYQEDTAAVWPDLQGAASAEKVVAVLADGMGGHVGGALASRMVCEALLGSLIDEKPTVMLTGEPPAKAQTAQDATTALIRRLAGGLEAANQSVARKVDEKPGLNGMGATAVALHLEQGKLLWISVGDSPLYLYRGGDLVQVNEDHSLAPEIDKLAKAGKISEAEAANDPRRHYLRSAVTGTQIEMIDVPEQPLVLREGDFLILASDGIQTLSHEEIAEHVAACERARQSHTETRADAIAGRLIGAVDRAGHPHQDNTTIIVIEVVAG
jgi:PPM family protein phosphatase